ncbi:glycosyltransferase family 4 protein [Nocardia cyriacigeorgica]|uniref:glycosyltransferase family 4 protein n=1 Tax=Nocardia cyriacigeorgica TaxID=135487 RepID=UPI001894A2C3|nr:glycosyltransferase family 4 protein [Nocardia cyriacigeorgica]MBF6289986.1 glycosyltransferase family 4 protein [Nocardia cyriacigeorgica]
MEFPLAMHILTYDMHGTVVATGQRKPCRHTGLVAHTHHLLSALAARHPGTRWAITQTGATRPGVYQLRTSDGTVVLAQGIRTGFGQYLGGADGGKDPARVRYFYEDTIDDPANPVYAGLARQYAHVIATADTQNLLAQNINPIVSVLKAEETGRLVAAGRLNVTGVVHDLAGAERRFDYLRRRLEVTEHSVRIVAVSTAVAEHLAKAGITSERVHTVPNGMDIAEFESRLHTADAQDAFAAVARRNRLPAGPMVLLSARRVAWKGHADLIAALRILAARSVAGEAFVVFNGHDMHDTRALDYTRELTELIAASGLAGRVFLLDGLSPVEVAACYRAAAVAVLPSRCPEAFGYANIEAMLAGIPVITTDHGGPRDYIDHGHSGLLVPPSDPAALADALARVLTDAALHRRLAREGRASAARFGVEQMAAGYAQVITSHNGVRP